MINYIEVKAKNFLSYGNNWTSFKFESGVIRVGGANGLGKSSIPLEALNFALFGKPYRKIKIRQLINSINRSDLQVELTFKKGEDTFRIERGLKPDYFRIFKNDEIVPVSSSKKGYQEILQEDILHTNENLANQIMFKSLTKDISFLTLSKHEKRTIVENLLDIELFSIINKNSKLKIDALELSVSSHKKDIDNYELLIEQELDNLRHLKEIKKKIEQESKSKITDIENEISELEQSNATYNIALKKISTQKGVKDKKSKELQSFKDAVKSERDSTTDIQSSIKLFENKLNLFKKTCGTCVKISELFKEEDLSELKSRMATHEELIAQHRKSIATLESEITKINEILANEKFVMGALERNQRRIGELQKTIGEEVKNEIVVDESKLKKYKKSKLEKESLYVELSDDKKHFQILRSLFSDDGIKSFIIKKYLPHINKLLLFYLRKFNTDISFAFDSEFCEVITSKFREDYSYFSFSEGQKRRIDLAILFAFIDFSKYKNKKANSNVLILDEITAGGDANLENCLFEIIKEIAAKENKCIITITHSPVVDPENINVVYNVSMEKGFSKLERVAS